MDQDAERDQVRRSYQSCGIGFSLYGFALTVSSVFSVGQLYLMFSGSHRNIIEILGIPHFEFGFGCFRVWTRLLASFFLCAAFTDVSWRRRSALLVLMGMADVVLWSVEHAMTLGLASEPPGHEALRQGLYMALVWSKFSLVARLAVDYAEHVGAFKPEGLGTATRATASTGMVVWFFYFLEHIDWTQSWPLAFRPWTKELFLFFLATMVMTSVCLVQTSLLCLRASRSAGHALRQMAKEDRSFDPWGNSA